ncbi:MAG: hypothetical protein K9G59_16680 [Caulobacter sp.]|nr:hypothetical protein [Caulobacter sp.]
MRTRWIVLAALAMTFGAAPVLAAEGGRLDDRAGAAASAPDVAPLKRVAYRRRVGAISRASRPCRPLSSTAS